SAFGRRGPLPEPVESGDQTGARACLGHRAAVDERLHVRELVVAVPARDAAAEVREQPRLGGGRQLAQDGALDVALAKEEAHGSVTSASAARRAGSAAARAISFIRRYLHRRALMPAARATSSCERSSTSESRKTIASSRDSCSSKRVTAARARATRA